jgi:hypothetical protein
MYAIKVNDLGLKNGYRIYKMIKSCEDIKESEFLEQWYKLSLKKNKTVYVGEQFLLIKEI